VSCKGGRRRASACENDILGANALSLANSASVSLNLACVCEFVGVEAALAGKARRLEGAGMPRPLVRGALAARLLAHEGESAASCRRSAGARLSAH